MVFQEALQEAAAGNAVAAAAAAVANGHTPGGAPAGSRRTSYAGHATQATTAPSRPSISLAPPGAGAGTGAGGGDGRAANGMPLPTAVGLRAFVEAAQGSELLRGYVRLYKTPPAKVRTGRGCDLGFRRP